MSGSIALEHSATKESSMLEPMTKVGVTTCSILMGVIALTGSRPASGDDAQAGWTPEMMLQVRRIAHVRPSPDATHVAYTVAKAVMTDDRSEYVSQVWMANADGSDAVPITFAEKSSTNPIWS